MAKKGAKAAAKRRAGVKKAAMRRRRTVRRDVPEQASCTEVRTLANLTTNQMYSLREISLDKFPRASGIAKGYQYYRIKNLKVVFKPLLDTFLAANNYTVPYMYWMIDRTRSLTNYTNPTQLRQLGARANRLDDKVITFQYRPSVLTSVLQDAPALASEFAEYKLSPWLPCRDLDTATPAVWNPSTVDHQGAIWIIENAGGAGTTAVPCSVEYVVEFEFKKPALAIVPMEQDPPQIELEAD